MPGLQAEPKQKERKCLIDRRSRATRLSSQNPPDLVRSNRIAFSAEAIAWLSETRSLNAAYANNNVVQLSEL